MQDKMVRHVFFFWPIISEKGVILYQLEGVFFKCYRSVNNMLVLYWDFVLDILCDERIETELAFSHCDSVLLSVMSRFFEAHFKKIFLWKKEKRLFSLKNQRKERKSKIWKYDIKRGYGAFREKSEWNLEMSLDFTLERFAVQYQFSSHWLYFSVNVMYPLIFV